MLDSDFLESFENPNPDLSKQVDILPWRDLARHFAFGRLYHVRKPWNLVEAAKAIQSDDADRLKAAMANQEFGLSTDSEASAWHEQKTFFQVLVIHPFVLVTPIE